MAGNRLFFLVQLGRKEKKVKRVIPLTNSEEAIDRANRELKLALDGRNVIDYLNFYYTFTPKDDPVPSENWQSAQFAVPRTVEDLEYVSSDAAGAPAPSPQQDRCSEDCLALGAIWHFLNSSPEKNFVVLRRKQRVRPYGRISGRICVRLERGLFAADFKIPMASGVPTLSNPELLYEAAVLKRPEELPRHTLPLPSYILRKEWWLGIKSAVNERAADLVRHIRLGLSWTVTIVLACFLALSALFPIVEILRYGGLRGALAWIGSHIGLEGWPLTLFALSTISIAVFLWLIYYKANMDKIFNWVFRLTPRRWERGIARKLNPLIDRYDRNLIAQDTFRKRAWMAIRLLLWWTAYVVLAFASVQMALNGLETEQTGSPEGIVLSLRKQATLNVPLIVYVMVRHPWLFGTLEPSGAGTLNGTLVFFFHLAVAAIILKGVYRIWVFTKEASPRVFYRKLHLHD